MDAYLLDSTLAAWIDDLISYMPMELVSHISRWKLLTSKFELLRASQAHAVHTEKSMFIETEAAPRVYEGPRAAMGCDPTRSLDTIRMHSVEHRGAP